MASSDNIQLRMPNREALVGEAIARLSTRPIRSQLLKLPDEILAALCLRLVDRTLTFADCWEWLNGELLAIGERAIDDNAVYRFKDNYLPIYDQVRAEHVRRISRLATDQVFDGAVGDMARTSKIRLFELLTEHLLDLNDFDSINPKQLTSIIGALTAHDAGDMKEREFDLKLQEAERRAEKLQQEIEKLRLENEERERKQRVAAEAVKTEATKQASKSDGKIDIDDVHALVDKVIKGEA